jgi:xanthine dehydrogenase small subunit
MPTRPIRFFHRGQIVEVVDAAPTRTVLEWLREDARCTGTKEGCNEGDCGACTVVLGELATANDAGAAGGLALRTVNACIQFLPTLDGKALFTVEDLKTIGDASAAAGNAGGRPVAARQRAADPSNRHAADSGQGEPAVAGATAAASLHPVQQAMVECHGSQCGFCTPGFVMSLWSTYEAHRARGTLPTRQQLADDLSGNLCRCTGYRPILDAGQRMFELPELIHVGAVEELKRIERRGGALRIGAGASLEEAFRALVATWPALEDVWLRFASVPIRNAGTMGGNVANGSPIGDSAPVLMALDAAIELRRGERVREMPLSGFYVDYMKNRLEPGEFVQALRVPLDGHTQVRAYKISKRFDCDISAVCAGLAIRLDGETVTAARFAFGGMAATVRRAPGAEAAVVGKPWNEATLAAAQRALADDYRPLTDMRASAGYRTQVAQNLLRRLWLETRTAAPLSTAELSVWSAMPHAPWPAAAASVEPLATGGLR